MFLKIQIFLVFFENKIIFMYNVIFCWKFLEISIFVDIFEKLIFSLNFFVYHDIFDGWNILLKTSKISSALLQGFYLFLHVFYSTLFEFRTFSVLT